jgi:crossover junction endodeoxyribonuclease RusA
VRLWIVFRFPLPGSDKYRTLHCVKPDLSKIIRSTEDAVVDAGILRDDSLVCSVRADKFYCHGDATPGATIAIHELGDFETSNRARLKELAKEARREGHGPETL